MKSAKINHKVSLRRKIFQYLLFTTFFSLALLGFFWFESVVKNFQNGVLILKETYSENKKAETKSKILEIKDWIYWVRSHPPGSVLKDLHVINNKSEIYLKDLEGRLQRYCLDSLSKFVMLKMNMSL